MSKTILTGPEVWYRQHPDVLFTRIDETESVLLSLRAQRYYTLNESGTCIWKALGAGAAPGDVAQALASNYDIAHAEALAYARAFVCELLHEELIQETQP